MSQSVTAVGTMAITAQQKTTLGITMFPSRCFAKTQDQINNAKPTINEMTCTFCVA